MYKALIFDWGGVLAENPTEGIISYCAPVFGVSQEQFRQAYAMYTEDFQKGILSTDDFFACIAEKTASHKPSSSLWLEAFASVYRPNPEMLELVASLYPHGNKIALLSNAEAESAAFFHGQHGHLFDEVIFSCAEGVMKPDAAIYLSALEKLKVAPHDAFFTDDRSCNVAGAAAVGIDAVLFCSARQIKDTLRSHHVLFGTC